MFADIWITIGIKISFFFKYKYAFCPDCYSSNVVKNGNYVRKLYFLNVGEQKCIIQKYKCKKCGKIFYTDIKSIVDENCNITKKYTLFLEIAFIKFSICSKDSSM